MVTQEEVQQCAGPLVQIALPGSNACDCDGNGSVSVDELIVATNNALDGCPATPTPTSTSPTLTPTPSATPTSCTNELPVVDPVMPTTTELQQTITGCGRFGGQKRVTVHGADTVEAFVTGSAGCGLGRCSVAQVCFQATVSLTAGQTNHIVVCQEPGLGCGALPPSQCVSVDANGDPLTITQVPAG